jgi:hypothetical protein
VGRGRKGGERDKGEKWPKQCMHMWINEFKKNVLQNAHVLNAWSLASNTINRYLDHKGSDITSGLIHCLINSCKVIETRGCDIVGGSRSWGHALEGQSLLLVSLFSHFPSKYAPCHNGLRCLNTSETIDPSDHKMKCLKPWSKIKFSTFKLYFSCIL